MLRQIPHLRLRTAKQGEIFRLRSDSLKALRQFFSSKDFTETNPPIITSSDCEGAGEVFTLTPQETHKNKSFERDDQKHFFDRPAFLTVSTQLHLEALALGLSRVYTISPAFRAEQSHTSRHLAEFWMLEAEVAFMTSLSQLTSLMEDMIKYTLNSLMEQNYHRDHWDQLLKPWKCMTYSEAIEELSAVKKTWKYPPKWGNDLSSEHEKYLCEILHKTPVFVTDYPQKIKPFYMKSSGPDTVAAVDLLVPQVGELAGGSLRKDHLDEYKTYPPELQWYLDLMKYSNAPHGGFGLGIERLIAFLEGENTNVKETIPFPRSVGSIFA